MYNHKEIEPKWQDFWEKNETFKVENDFSKPKYYCLDMFPYPSGAWLHVGHPEWYTANDILARYKHAKWYNVLHPMGWDAFWLPAENYAIKTWTHPRITTDQNISNFKKQINKLGFSYDWDREIDTTDPKYYKWTQWIFLKLFEKGLAYEQDLPINYCPSCKTGLANEEVLNDFTCERCWEKVEKRKIRQWVLAITKYADRLLKDVDRLDWPEGIKDMQKNWIWKSEGCEFEMKKSWDDSKSIRVYTTRIDTVFGMTYAVLAPDHKDVEDFISDECRKECEKYISDSLKQSDQDRTADNKEKTWVFTGSYIVNPFNGQEVPLWIWDYVLGNYGTWAVMSVPAHDERDFEFAMKYDLEIKQSIVNQEENVDVQAKAFTEYWILIDSWQFTWMISEEAKSKMSEFATEQWFGHKKVNYKLRDWLFSRQRYWGEPIPLIHLSNIDIEDLPKEKCDDAWVKDGDILMIWDKEFSKIYDGLYGKIVCDYNLPLELPEVDEYEPAWDGHSPLVKVDDFVNVKLAENLYWKRETNTMPQWGWSCWYYLRFMDPTNDDDLVNKDVVNYWWEVDSYVGWAEHAVLHLLYARFWHKFLFDIWVVPTDEPFYRLKNQWLILAHAFQRKNWWLLANDLVEEQDWKYFEIGSWEEVNRIVSKMSKSLKNVINPDDIVEEYWADSLRLYEMYMAEFKDTAPWDTRGIVWVRRFLEKVEREFVLTDRLWTPETIKEKDEEFSMKLLHKTIKKVWEDIENYKFNTAIAALIILLKHVPWKNYFVFRRTFLKLLHPFAPHLAEELWEQERIWLLNLWHKLEWKDEELQNSIFYSKWPEYDEKMIVDDVIKIAVQVLGKLRGTIEIPKDLEKDEVLKLARENKNVSKWIEWKNLIKEIYVPWKIVNFVVK